MNSMKKSEIQSELNKMIGGLTSEFGFKYKKKDFEYISKEKKINCIFSIEMHHMTGWKKISPAIFIGSTVINKICNHAIGVKDPVNGMTCGFGIRNVHNDRGNYELNSASDIQPIAEFLKSDFHEIALPFFEKYGSLSGIDSYMNKEINGLFMPGTVGSACSGLIAARLCDNPHFDKIYEDYYELSKKYQGPKLSEPVRTVRDYLLKHYKSKQILLE